MSVLSYQDKAKIDSLTEAELRYEVVKGRDSIYQGNKLARIKARLAVIDARVPRRTNKIAFAALIVSVIALLFVLFK